MLNVWTCSCVIHIHFHPDTSGFWSALCAWDETLPLCSSNCGSFKIMLPKGAFTSKRKWGRVRPWLRHKRKEKRAGVVFMSRNPTRRGSSCFYPTLLMKSQVIWYTTTIINKASFATDCCQYWSSFKDICFKFERLGNINARFRRCGRDLSWMDRRQVVREGTV